MTNFNFARIFWEKKILKWEMLRYSKWLIIYPLSWTIRKRLYLSIKTIKERSQKKCSVLELGCGSGVLAEGIYPFINSYIGIDIAQNAIDHAKEKMNYPNFNFKVADVTNYTFEQCELTIFLGLTDWLNLSEIEKIFSSIDSPTILFSFTEKRIVSKLNPYYYYRKIIDRHSSKNEYIAKTYSFDEINFFLKKSSYSAEVISSSSFFDPGVLIWAKK